MGLDTNQARALSRSLHDLSLSEPPPSRSLKKHRRQRSASANDTFISTATVTSADSTAILSSLISSLTVLSDSARSQLRKEKLFQPAIQTTSHRFPTNNSRNISEEEDSHMVQENTAETSNDEDIAEAPIAGYARRGAKTPSRMTKDRWYGSRSRQGSQQNISRPSSSLAFTTPRSSTSMGVPSIERPQTSATIREFQDTSGTIEQFRKGPLQTFFSSRSGDDHIRPSSSRKENDTTSIRTLRSRHGNYRLREDNKETSTLTSSTITVNRIPRAGPIPIPIPIPATTHSPERYRIKPSAGSSPETTRHNPLSPAHRDDLGEHLIPSRSSSLRHSPGKSRKSSSISGRPSTSSRDRKAVDEPLPLPLDEEDSTTRRIRELQKAREQRQAELQKESESRRSDRARKRISLPGTSHRPETLVRSSTQPVLSTADVSENQGLAPGENGIKEDAEPALVYDIVTLPPVPPLSSGTVPTRSASLVKSGTPTTIPSSLQRTRGLSGSIRRLNSLNKRNSVEVKSVSEEVDTFLNSSRLTQRVQHQRTGRTIAFSEVGDPEGFVVFVCVGMGLTRYVTSFYEEVARTQRLRLITPDRPGIGESSSLADGSNTPLAWVDDVTVICHALNVQRFSLLAHSAGAIYALAIALKMPQYVRGRIHLLAPWIPPSQMAASGTTNIKTANLPTSHKLLSMLPAPFLKAANSRFLSATSASLDTKSRSKTHRQASPNYDNLLANEIANDTPYPGLESPSGRVSALSARVDSPRFRSPQMSPIPRNYTNSPSPLDPEARATLYNTTLTHKTWSLATTNANPAIDLIICLERRRSVGFLYRDVTRPIVIHHGRNDTRVPLENVRWLESVLARCELRILDNEEHGLMGSAKVMSEVLCEIGREWEEWDVVARDKERRRKVKSVEKEERTRLEREKFIRTGKY